MLLVIATLGGAVVIAGIVALIVARSYRRVAPGQALIVNGMSTQPRVTFTGALVLPIVHRAELIDLSVKRIVIARCGRSGLICADNIRADIEVTFFVRVNTTQDDILRVAQAIGCVGASQLQTLEELFTAKFSEAMKTVAKQLEFEQLFTQRDMFKDQILAVIGKDLNGFVLDDLAIDALEQTPIAALDPDNIHDALGLRKLRTLTADANADLAHVRATEHVKATEHLKAMIDQRDRAATELESLGLLDIRVGIEVSCDVPAERTAMTAVLGDTTIGLPAEITPAIVEAVGRGELVVANGRATVRFADARATSSQVIAAARIVNAVRAGSAGYR